MGFNSTGVVISGGRSASVAAEGFLGSSRAIIYQIDSFETTRYAGISLSSAQSKKGEAGQSNMKDFRLAAYGKGENDQEYMASWFVAPGVIGTNKRVSYSRIGDSNLFEATVEEHSLSVGYSVGNDAIIEQRVEWD